VVSKVTIERIVKREFYPNRAIRELRDLTRYKTKLTNQISAEKNRFQKILEDANIKLSVVLSNVFGSTGKK
jgi:transposase